MPAHVVYPALDPEGLPATVSYAIQTGILRDELGFDGLIITDDMGMKGITNILPPEESGVAAVLAGADVVLCVRLDSTSSCTPEMIDPLREGLLTAAREGKLSPERIDESVRRVLAAKLRYAVGPVGDTDLTAVNGASHLRAVIDMLTAVADRKAEEGLP
jgi:beta-N-acetylhexosaminidase